MMIIRSFAGLIFALLSFLASSAEMPSPDGVWLRDSIEAFNRIGTGGTQDDLVKGMAIAGWIGGVIATQRDTTSRMQITMGFFAYSYREFTQKKDEKNAALVRQLYSNARMYAPKFNIPSNVQIQQIMAVVLKYLNAHPEKWQYSAISLTNEALAEAFPEPILTQELK